MHDPGPLHRVGYFYAWYVTIQDIEDTDVKSCGFFFVGFSGTYFLQKLLSKRLPYPQKTIILVSTIIGTGASYKVTADRTKSCQAGWMAAEGKFTALSNPEEDDRSV